jgi:beta-1,2-mannosidase
VVKIDDIFYLTYAAYDGKTARLALASSKDLHTWQKHGLLFPEKGWTKSGAILSTPIHGKYWMYFGDSDVWAAYSENLLDWTVIEKSVIQPRPNHFDSLLVEPGPQPVLTEDGILLLYNGADKGAVYACGQVLLDRLEPTRVIARSEDPFLVPTTEIELTGQVPNVTFIEGLVWFKNRWLLYYGMGDSGIGVSTFEP